MPPVVQPQAYQPPPRQSEPAAYDPHAENDPTAECSEDGTFGLVMYLLPLLGLSTLTGSLGIPLGGVVAPLILWLLKRDNSKYLDATGKEVVNFNLCVVAAFAALKVLGWIGSIIFLGWLFRFIGTAAWLAWVVVTVISAVSANGGKFYRFPLSYRWIK